MNVLIVGCGYVGSELVRQAPDAWNFSALTRSQERADELKQCGVQPLVGSWLDEESARSALREGPTPTHVLVSVPHREDAGLGKETHIRGLQSVMNALGDRLGKLLYLSTTGVYGAVDNERVDEQTPVSPTRTGPQIAVAAEQWLKNQAAESRLDVTVLRLAGIYGPGRVPLAAKLRAGEPLSVPQHGCLNLIHVTDIARVLLHTFENSLQETLYVLSDGHPVERGEFYRYLATCCGVDSPVFLPPEQNDSRTRRATNKKVDPSLILDETGLELLYQNYEAGLKQSLQQN